MHAFIKKSEAYSVVSYYSHSFNYLVVAVVVAQAQNMHFKPFFRHLQVWNDCSTISEYKMITKSDDFMEYPYFSTSTTTTATTKKL